MDLENIKEILKNIKRTKFGISIPSLRIFAKDLAKNQKSFINLQDFSSHELKLLYALFIGYLDYDINFLMKYFDNFIKYVDTWDINDLLCQNFKIARKYPKIFFDFLMKYKDTKKEFESRIVSVSLLTHFLNDEYIDKVISILNNLNTDKYYSMMGVAWAIAIIAAKFPEKCLEFLKSKNCNLDKITFNKTLQKIKESFRVKNEIKILIKDMKKM